MTESTAHVGDNRGRPRRFDEATERTMLLDAAMRVMTQRGFSEMSVADVLGESGLSTRSFYRQFESKDALLSALVRREVGSVTRFIERQVSAAEGPAEAIAAWIDAVLRTSVEPRRAERSRAFTAPAVLAMSPLSDDMVQIRAGLCRPLADVLRSGAAAGTVVTDDPGADAATVFAITTGAALDAGAGADRDALRARVGRFVFPAFGLTPPG